MEFYPLFMFIVAIIILLLGYPVAFSLAGSSILCAIISYILGDFDFSFFGAIPERIQGIMGNETLIAIPLFIFMGFVLEKSKISEELLAAMGNVFSKIKGGLAISVCIVGALLAASTGIVGATVVTMGLISLPVMLKYQYNKKLACGVICASGTLGQIIPPSIVLIILGDVMSSANQQAQLALGNFTPNAVSVGDLFVGSIFPGLLLVILYIVYISTVVTIFPHYAPKKSTISQDSSIFTMLKAIVTPLLLIIGVLGSILYGIATPTEAASVGGVGSILLAFLKKRLTKKIIKDVLHSVTKINCMVFTILIGSSFFSLVFRAFGGDDIIANFLNGLPGGKITAIVLVMSIMFVMGFFLDFFEITFVVVPIVGPILLQMGYDPIWLGVLIAVNLQTSFLTPPFGFSLFYLRGVAPPSIKTTDIYVGVMPFILIQILVIIILWCYPGIVTWLPNKVYS